MTLLHSANSPKRPPKSGTAGGRLRVLFWGVAALAAVAGLVGLADSDAGQARLLATVLGGPEPITPLVPDAAASADDERLDQFAETVRVLAEERDTLSRRLAALERTQQETTANGTRALERAAAAERALADRLATERSAPPAPVAAAAPRVAPSPVPPGFVLLEPALGFNRQPFSEAYSLGLWSRAPAPRPEPEIASVAEQPPAPEPAAEVQPPEPDPTPTAALPPQRKEYAVDLGGAASSAGLRETLSAARARNPGALDKLRPVVGARAGSREPRLVLGPLPTPGAAARLCATVVAAGGACQPVAFDPQRPALR